MKKDKGDMSDIKNEIELQLLSDLDRISMRQWRRVIVAFSHESNKPYKYKDNPGVEPV